jgi:hypothetical protein
MDDVPEQAASTRKDTVVRNNAQARGSLLRPIQEGIGSESVVGRWVIVLHIIESPFKFIIWVEF